MGPRVTTEYGELEGRAESGVEVFRGIPYAAPPFGALRFHYPAAPAAWDGVRDASTSGPGAPQPGSAEDDIDRIYANPAVQGEDCLTLDVWTPDSSASGLPVMVWIHGGAFIFGAGSTIAYSGRTFARDGVVHVGINYRLGVEGFVYLGEGTDNLGLRDQVFALEWVKRNIASFGGDPGNVTIFGQSAGSIAVMELLAMPSAQGLFSAAIAQSGTPVATVDPREAMRWTRRLAKRLGVPATREGFASVAPQDAVAQVMPYTLDFVNPLRHGSQSFLVSPFRAVHGTPSLPLPPLEAARAKPGVPLLTGTVRNEVVGFLRALGRLDRMNPLVARVFLRTLGATRAIRKTYRTGPRHITNPVALVEAAWTDWTARIPTIRLAEARPGLTYLYEFRWENPNLPAGLGASHALETPFTRDDVDALLALGPLAEAMIGTSPPPELASRMHSAWIAFAKSHDPGWPPYETNRRETMVFGATSGLVSDAAAPERQVWQGRR